MRRGLLIAMPLLVASWLAVQAPHGNATFSGQNGVIVFSDQADATTAKLQRIAADGTGLDALTAGPNDFAPSFSKDGGLVVFDRNGSLALLDMSDESVDVLTADVDGREPSFSPDGERIVHVRGSTSAGSDLWVLTIDDEEVRLTNTSGQSESSPKYSPSGSKIVFSRSDVPSGGGTVPPSDIFVMNADGTGVTNLTNTTDRSEVDPDWSPDGTTILFARDGEIVKMPAAGGDATVVAVRNEIDGNPVYSPDGTKIAFESEAAGKTGLFVMDADGTNAKKITPDAVDADHPTWQPVVPTPTGTPRPIGGDTQSAGKASSTSVVPGQQVDVTGGGFVPDRRLEMEFQSTPVALGATRSNDEGTFSVRITIPASATAGAHQIVVSGPNAQGGTHRNITAVTVSAAAAQGVSATPAAAAATGASGDDDLPASGGGGRSFTWSLWLLVAGVLLVGAEAFAPARFKPVRFGADTFAQAWERRG